MLRTDAVVTSQQPAFQIREHQMHDWQICLGHRRVPRHRNRDMAVSALRQFVVAGPCIGNDLCSWLDRTFDKADQRFRRTVRTNFKPNPTRVSAMPTLNRFATDFRFAATNFNSRDDQRQIVDTTAKTARSSTYKRLVD